MKKKKEQIKLPEDIYFEKQLSIIKEKEDRREQRKEFWTNTIWGYFGNTVCFIGLAIAGFIILGVLSELWWKLNHHDDHIRSIVRSENQKYVTQFELEEAVKRMPHAELYLGGGQGKGTNGEGQIFWWNNVTITNTVK